MQGVFTAVLLFGLLAAAAGTAGDSAAWSTAEQQRKNQLEELLCSSAGLECAYVKAVFADSRLTIYGRGRERRTYHPQREQQANPYLTNRFGLLAPESLDRCRRFLEAHKTEFARAYSIYGVPPEIICGILRIETNYGIATKLSPNPLGTHPAINQLLTLYVCRPARESSNRFVRRQRFAFEQMKALLHTGHALGWDLFQIPGSRTGAIGLVQFEPSSLDLAIDGDGDGKVDLFDPADAILSAANYLATRGWDGDRQHQSRAVCSYYGGDCRNRQTKDYLIAVLKYANEANQYLEYDSAQFTTSSKGRGFKQ